MVELLKCIVDNGEMTQYKEGYGKTIVCAYARIDGWSVGIVANNRMGTKTAPGEMQFGGVIYSDSADKATRFIMNCNQKKIPLVFLHDVTGFMVGKRSEHGGIICFRRALGRLIRQRPRASRPLSLPDSRGVLPCAVHHPPARAGTRSTTR